MFYTGANSGTDNPNINTNVTFRLVKRPTLKRVVVVMDISGSMVSWLVCDFSSVYMVDVERHLLTFT